MNSHSRWNTDCANACFPKGVFTNNSRIAKICQLHQREVAFVPVALLELLFVARNRNRCQKGDENILTLHIEMADVVRVQVSKSDHHLIDEHFTHLLVQIFIRRFHDVFAHVRLHTFSDDVHCIAPFKVSFELENIHLRRRERMSLRETCEGNGNLHDWVCRDDRSLHWCVECLRRCNPLSRYIWSPLFDSLTFEQHRQHVRIVLECSSNRSRAQHLADRYLRQSFLRWRRRVHVNPYLRYPCRWVDVDRHWPFSSHHWYSCQLVWSMPGQMVTRATDCSSRLPVGLESRSRTEPFAFAGRRSRSSFPRRGRIYLGNEFRKCNLDRRWNAWERCRESQPRGKPCRHRALYDSLAAAVQLAGLRDWRSISAYEQLTERDIVDRYESLAHRQEKHLRRWSWSLLPLVHWYRRCAAIKYRSAQLFYSRHQRNRSKKMPEPKQWEWRTVAARTFAWVTADPSGSGNRRGGMGHNLYGRSCDTSDSENLAGRDQWSGASISSNSSECSVDTGRGREDFDSFPSGQRPVRSRSSARCRTVGQWAPWLSRSSECERGRVCNDRPSTDSCNWQQRIAANSPHPDKSSPQSALTLHSTRIEMTSVESRTSK